jgi:hypothetical protein
MGGHYIYAFVLSVFSWAAFAVLFCAQPAVIHREQQQPGAVRNSVALKSIPRLKAIFDTYYSKQPKKFIDLFLENKELPIGEIIALFERETASKGEIMALDVVKPISQVAVSARAFVANYAVLVNGGVRQ